MKKKIISLLLVLIMILSSCFILAACNDNEGDDDPSKKPPINTGGEGDWWSQVMYDETELRFQLTECPDAGLHPNTKRLLEGKEEASLGRPLDDMIAERNDNAYFNTKVKVTYLYYGTDETLYGWSNVMNTIYNEVQNKSQYSPDIYCNFMSDMLATSLKGSFANVLSESRNSAGVGTVSNFFKVDASINNEGYEHSGYMSDLMSSLTLSDEKFYVIASDYFIDLIRAFFVVPVNRTLYNSIAPKMFLDDKNNNGVQDEGEEIIDLNHDGVVDMNDFFVEVTNNDWTYDRLIQYCAAVAVDRNNNGSWEYVDTLGFALDREGGMMASGLMYTTTCVIINKTWNEDDMQWEYGYPQSKDANNNDVEIELFGFISKVNTLFSSKGVTSFINDEVGKAPVQAICEKFVANDILFGGIITVGNLENSEYQGMKGEKGGFGVVPVPVYTNIDPKTGEKFTYAPYQTQIHTSGGAGGISHVTTKFTQCSAFIHYQSTHSTEILNEYYDNNLTLDVSDGLQGNVDMLKYIRNNVRTSFDKLFEDAIAFFNLQTDSLAKHKRWHHILMGQSYKIDSFRTYYDQYVGKKQDQLLALVDEYVKLPD